MNLSLSQVAGFVQASGEYDPQAVVAGCSIDSRTIQQGELFFAVRGERLAGQNLYVPLTYQNAPGRS